MNIKARKILLPILAVIILNTSLIGVARGSAQTAGLNVDDPAQLRLVVGCEQRFGRLDGGQEASSRMWIGSTGKPLSHGRRSDSSGYTKDGTLLWDRTRFVIGVLAKEIDLSQDDVAAKQILDSAVRFAQTKCVSDGFTPGGLPDRPVANIVIEVRHGDPATFTDEKFTGSRRHPDNRSTGWTSIEKDLESFRKDYPIVAIEGKTSTDVERLTVNDKEANWTTSRGRDVSSYTNLDKERFDQAVAAKAREAQEAARRAQQVEAERLRIAQAEAQRAQQAQLAAAQRAAQQKKQRDIAVRSAAFVSANGVRHFVTAKELAANPFIFKGQVVAVHCYFKQMRSATEGLFAYGDTFIVVSGVPSTRFTREGPWLLLAGRVQGNKEINFPFGNALVPHLSYVGSASCDQVNCDN